MRRLLVVAALCCAAVTLGATAATSAPATGLRSFASCGQLNGYLKVQALRRVGPAGFGSGTVREGVLRADLPGTSPAGGAPEASAPVLPEVAFSGTNVQEAGVDEPDVVKTDGRVLFTVARGRVQAVAVGSAGSRQLGSLTLPGLSPESLLLVGPRLLVISRATLEPLPAPGAVGISRVAAPGIAFTNPFAAVVSEVDVRDPAAMRVVTTLRLEGNVVAARQVGTSVRIVISTPFDVLPVDRRAVDVASAQLPGPTQAQRNRAAVRRARITDWLPRYRLKRSGEPVRRGVVTGCKRVNAPVRFGGFGTVSVVTLDASNGLRIADSDTIVSGSDVVYASPTSLYVATSDWYDIGVWQERRIPPPGSTRIHRFDISDPVQTVYRASGSVPGFVPGQWAMSERAGLLRVASTQEPAWWQGNEARQSESHVSVLGEQDGRLLTVGHVAGIGRGERITGVRFIGDVGYVVTFRQVDPLHIVDVATPSAPKLRGELQIPGFSAYLHPVGDGLLLGVGQDADARGQTLGTQVSLFDVSNLDAPARIASLRLTEGTFSEAEWDHKAFTYWTPTGLAVIPFTDGLATGVPVATPVAGAASSAKAAGFRVAGRTLTDAGRIVHPFVRVDGDVSASPIRRSVVVGPVVYSVSEDGIRASDLTTLAPTGWMAFPVD